MTIAVAGTVVVTVVEVEVGDTGAVVEGEVVEVAVRAASNVANRATSPGSAPRVAVVAMAEAEVAGVVEASVEEEAEVALGPACELRTGAERGWSLSRRICTTPLMRADTPTLARSRPSGGSSLLLWLGQ